MINISFFSMDLGNGAGKDLVKLITVITPFAVKCLSKKNYQGLKSLCFFNFIDPALIEKSVRKSGVNQ